MLGVGSVVRVGVGRVMLEVDSVVCGDICLCVL